MDKIKKNWYIIIIGILLLFGMNRCATACSRSQQVALVQTEVQQKDSVITVLNDSIRTLNQELELAKNDNENYKKNIEVQQNAIDKITEAKKNIHVTVKK